MGGNKLLTMRELLGEELYDKLEDKAMTEGFAKLRRVLIGEGTLYEEKKSFTVKVAEENDVIDFHVRYVYVVVGTDPFKGTVDLLRIDEFDRIYCRGSENENKRVNKSGEVRPKSNRKNTVPRKAAKRLQNKRPKD